MTTKDPIAAAAAQRDAADLILARHRLPLVKRARELMAGMQSDTAELARIRDQLDAGHARDNLGHMVNMLRSVDTALGHDQSLHERTVERLAPPAIPGDPPAIPGAEA